MIEFDEDFKLRLFEVETTDNSAEDWDFISALKEIARSPHRGGLLHWFRNVKLGTLELKLQWINLKKNEDEILDFISAEPIREE